VSVGLFRQPSEHRRGKVFSGRVSATGDRSTDGCLCRRRVRLPYASRSECGTGGVTRDCSLIAGRTTFLFRGRKGEIVGVWGTGLFSDDLACDIRDHYRELLEDGIEDGEATRRVLEKFQAYFDEPEGIALLAFAVTQAKLGRLDPDIRQRALAVLDR